jgi:trimeric autotransporter adhesin
VTGLLSLLAALAFGPLAGGRSDGTAAVVRHGAVASPAAGTKLPLAAEGPVSHILGRDDFSYRAVRAGGGSLVLRNRGQHLSAWFDRRGVLIRSGAEWLRLSLTGYRYGEMWHAVGGVRPRAQANRVVYQREAFGEWYANGPLGLEQGFTFPARPGGEDPGPLTLSLALSGNVRGALSRGADAVTFTQPGVSLAYRGLVATDARGRQLPARMELRAGRLLLQIDDRGASYPLRIDPFVQQAKLTASEGTAGDALGFSVAMSGNTVVAGAPSADTERGAVYVFVEPAEGWASETEAAKLTASDGRGGSLGELGDWLGFSVAMSGDTVVAGAPNATAHGVPTAGAPFDQGAAYVFVKPAGGWASETEAAKLTASDGAIGDLFGTSVAVSGNTVVVGAPAAIRSEYLGAQGAAYVFVEPVGGWASETEAAKLTVPQSSLVFGAFLGTSVAVSGNTVVAGAPNARVNDNPLQGAAYVFVEPASGWTSETETAELTASDGALEDNLGSSVAVSGSTVVAGAPNATVGGNTEQGAVYVFAEPPSGWASETQAAKLTAPDGDAYDELGTSVAVSANTVVAGPHSATVNGNPGQGAAYVFVEPAGGWASETQAAKLTASDGAAADQLGFSVAVSGNTVVAGAPHAALNGSIEQGAAYVFVAQDPTRTSVGCSPRTVSVGGPTTCTATVTDTAASPVTPTGTVSFSPDTSGGAFSHSGSCTLSPTASTGTSACVVTYSPGQVGSGTHTITARYGGDSAHVTSTGSTTVTVTKRTTRTRVRCTTIRPRLRSCSALVTDTDSGTRTTPTGTVTFTTTSSISTFTGNPCMLSGSGASARCSVTYRPTIGTQTITATYNGNSTHATSSGSTRLRERPCRSSCRRWRGR